MLAASPLPAAVSDSEPPPPPPLDDSFDLPTIKGLRAGDVLLGRFRLAACLGRGGMGEVWQAHDTTLGEDIALKLLPRLIHADEQAVEDLKNETRRGRQLSHPHVVRVFDFYQDDQNVGIAMELVKGENLAKLRVKQANQVFDVVQISAWVLQLLDALDYAHRTASVVHRDLKPANLLIDAASNTLKVADFGIARCLVESLQRVTLSAQSRGTLCYMSPEQAIGRGANPLDDLYAVGASLYELFAGTPPFYQGDVYTQIQKVPPQPISHRLVENGISAPPPPPAWEATIMRCLAKARADRPQSAGEIAEMLGLRASGQATPYVPAITTPAAPPTPPSPGPPPVPAAPAAIHAPMTGSVAISTSAPIVTVSAADQHTQRSFVDLTRTAGRAATATTSAVQGTTPAAVPSRSPVGLILGVLGVLVIAAAGAGYWFWQKHHHAGVQTAPGGTFTVTPTVSTSPGDATTTPPVAPAIPAPAATTKSLPPAGEDWHVPSTFFQTIAQAIEAAPPGQRIRLGSQRWKERITLTKPVQLIGDSAEQTVLSLDGRTGSILEIQGAGNVVIETMSFEHESTEAVSNGPPLVRIENASVTIRRCLFGKSAGDGIVAGDKGSVQAEDCRFEQNALAGVRAGTGGSIQLKTPVFRGNDVGILASGDRAQVTCDRGEFQTHTHHAVETASAARVKLTGAKINDCGENGIFAHDAGSAIEATGVEISKCKEGTKLTDGASATLTDCIHKGNIVGFGARNAGAISLTGGQAGNNATHGLVIESDAKAGSILISGMKIRSNPGVGLFLSGTAVKPDVADNEFGPNGQLDVLLRDGAGGRFTKNTLHTGPDFKAFIDATPDWQANNTEQAIAPASN